MQYEDHTRIHITNRSILDLDVDAIVNSAAAKPQVGVPYNGKKTLDYMIYDAAGYQDMLTERKEHGYLKVACCCSTSSYKLSDRGIKRVIHVNVPRNDIQYNELDSQVLLARCYFNVRCEAKRWGLTSIAIPLLGTGNKNYEELIAIVCMMYGTKKFLLSFMEYPIDITISIISESAFNKAKVFFTTFCDPTEHYTVPDFCYDEAKNKGYFTGRRKKSLINEVTVGKKLAEKGEIIEAVASVFDELIGIELTESRVINKREDNPLLDKIRELIEVRNYSQPELCERSNLSTSQLKDILANKRGYKRESIIGLCFGFCLSFKESMELMQAAGFAFQGTRGDRIIVEGIKKIECIINNKNGRELSKSEIIEIVSEINDQLIKERIDYVFIGSRKQYLGS